jgi:uncharacterized repeat protein (TIGR01451 family)
VNTRYLRLFLVLLSAVFFVFVFLGSAFAFGLSMNPVSAREALGSQSANPGDVLINEFVVKGSEWVELYNKSGVDVSLDGWYVTDVACDPEITNTLGGADVITVGGYFVIDDGAAGDNFDWDSDGDVAILCDAEHQALDRVAYGDQGGAPLAHTGDAIARAPNGVDTGDDARDWNVAPDPTSGEANNAAGVALGTTLVINEIEGGSGDAYKYPQIELYNPTSSTITVTDWLHSDGDITPKVLITETAVIAPGECFVFRSSTPNILEKDMIYLFMPDGTRVDQVAGEGIEAGFTLQRVPDGAGPHDGYDWDSSGGGVSWFKLPATLGERNARRLDISKSGPVVPVSPSDSVSFTLTYSNPLSETAHGVIITDVLPPGVSYARFVTSTANLTLTKTTPLVWEVGTLVSHTAGITFTVWTTFTGLFDAAHVENMSWIDSSTAGFVPVSDTYPIEVSIYDPELAITKAVTPVRGLSFKDTVTYTIVLHNSGQGVAKGVVMTDPLTACVNFGGWVDVDRDLDSAVMPPPSVKWGAWDIPANTAYTIVFTATIADDSACAGMTVTNTAYFVSANAGMDSARAAFTVSQAGNYIFLPLVLRN